MTLHNLRHQIDEVDAAILRLIHQRLDLAARVGEIKHKENLPVYAPDREEALLRRLEQLNHGARLPAPSLRAIFREIISASINLEKPITVAFLGPEATWTHQAALAKFGSSVTLLPCPGIPDVFAEVQAGRADFGVVPIENSTEGSVGQTLDGLMESPLSICGEELLRIEHNLAGHGPLQAVRRVFSHSQSFGQCRLWLRANLPSAELVPVASNALAAQMAAADPATAAICGQLAARLHNLPILAPAIQDIPDNTTRFIVLGRIATQPTGADKTSLLLTLQDRVGALHQALEPFRANGVSLLRIESRPSRRKKWEYIFFIDIPGHAQDEPVARALAALKEQAASVRILGSYPAVPA